MSEEKKTDKGILSPSTSNYRFLVVFILPQLKNAWTLATNLHEVIEDENETNKFARYWIIEFKID